MLLCVYLGVMIRLLLIVLFVFVGEAGNPIPKRRNNLDALKVTPFEVHRVGPVKTN
jgi:hypothetical protein